MPAQETNTAADAVRFGVTADAHFRVEWTQTRKSLDDYVAAMREWQPDFVVDLGDFGIQAAEGQTTAALHDGQLAGLKNACDILAGLSCPRHFVIGNHDVGWFRGGNERITFEDLIQRPHAGEDITKAELTGIAGTPGRYYSFDVKGIHFIVLDGNNAPPPGGERGHDGVLGAYWVDDDQKAWLVNDLAANGGKRKIVFCHEELHHTAPAGSGEDGDVPFPAVGKENSYVDNGWEMRKLFATDGNVIACFFGHKHDNRWTVYGGVHYITLAALHAECSYAKVTIADKLYVEGVGKQRNYALPLPPHETGETTAEP